MPQFTLKDPRKMGDKDPKYGQSYWSYTHESATPVKFNLMEGEVSEGQKITCEEYSVRTSSKGTEYNQLKKVKVDGTVSGSTANVEKREWVDHSDDIKAQWAIGQALSKFPEGVYEASEADRVTMLANIQDFAEELYEMIDKVKDGLKADGAEGSPKESGYDKAKQVRETFSDGSPVVDEVIEVDESMPINLDDIPF